VVEKLTFALFDERMSKIMGIRSFYKWVSWACKSPPLQIEWDQWKHTTVGIDILGFLYSAKQNHTSPVEWVADLIVELRKHAITPLFVFDGKVPQEKTTTHLVRKRQKEQMTDENRERSTIHINERNEIKQLLYASGCLAINAEHEADSVLAYLARENHISAVLTLDTDFLARGVRSVVLYQRNAWVHYSLPTILSESQLSYDQFVDMCVLMGTDYNPSIPTLSYQRIYWTIRYHESEGCMEDLLKREGIRTPTLWIQARAILKGANDSLNTLLCEKQREKLYEGPPPVEPEFIHNLFHDSDKACSLLTPSLHRMPPAPMLLPSPLISSNS
jgi:5'-3' exonuclease